MKFCEKGFGGEHVPVAHCREPVYAVAPVGVGRVPMGRSTRVGRRVPVVPAKALKAQCFRGSFLLEKKAAGRRYFQQLLVPVRSFIT